MARASAFLGLTVSFQEYRQAATGRTATINDQAARGQQRSLK
jgi:hypothetical protein